MQTRSCVISVVLVAVLGLWSHVRAQCLKNPTGSGACTAGKLDLTVSTSSSKGFLSMTHCPFPPGLSGLTAPPLTLTITPPGFVVQFTVPVVSGRGPCQGSDQYLGPSGERLKYVFGSGETVLATHLNGVPLPGSAVTVTITDDDGYTVGATLTCTATKSRIRCR